MTKELKELGPLNLGKMPPAAAVVDVLPREY
jgi:hypothetical protein